MKLKKTKNMKTIQQISKILFAVLIVIISANSVIAEDIKESFEETYGINATGEFSFSCYESDLKINTWDKNEIKLVGEIIIDSDKKDDIDKLLDVFKNPKVIQSENQLNIKTDIAKNTIVIGPVKKITLVNGKTIRIDKFKANYTLWIPKTINFELKSKYNNVDIADLTGELDFDLYEVDLTLLSFVNGKFDMKYSNAEIGKGKSANFNIYECDVEIKEVNTIKSITKYSKFNVEIASSISVNSYDDKFRISTLNKELTGEAKYSDFNIESNTEIINMNVYESDITVLNVNNVSYLSKYSTFNAQNINSMKCQGLYEAKIFAAVVSDFSCVDSKYDKISFKEIKKSIDISNAYELDLQVELVNATFEKFYGNFKYGSVRMNLDPKLDFKLDFNTSYGNVDFPKNRLKINDLTIIEDSKYTFEGSTIENANCIIKFKSYDTDFELR